MKKWKKTILIVLAALIALAGALVIGLYLGGAFQEKQAEEKAPVIAEGSKYTNENNYDDIEENPSISVPGFDSVYLKANETHQYFTFHNPEQNTCYFEIVLSMEDGTVLWTSDYLEPGMAISEFDMNQPLSAGVYENATISYHCYSLKTLAPFNSGAVKVNIVVE